MLINITGSEDMDLEDVETAANLVQEAAHPDANIIVGASFDENLQDEIRVTVIATGFEASSDAAAQAQRDKAASAPIRPIAAAADKPQGLFSGATEKAAAAVAPAKKPEPEPESASSDEDPFDSIFKIFNAK